MLRDGQQPYIVKLQLVLVYGAYIAIAAEPVQLVHYHRIKQVLFHIRHHPLEFRAVIAFCGAGAVYIGGHKNIAIVGGVFLYGAKLRLNGFFALHLAGEAAVCRYPANVIMPGHIPVTTFPLPLFTLPCPVPAFRDQNSSCVLLRTVSA